MLFRSLSCLEPSPAEDERAMVDVLEIGLAVETARDPHERRTAAEGDLEGLGNGDLASGGKEAADPEARAIAPEHGDSAAQGGDADEDHHEAVHGRE